MIALETDACRLFGVKYPIVQTGMGWVAGARLTAATSAAGGLGILASATMTYDELVAAIHGVKERNLIVWGQNYVEVIDSNLGRPFDAFEDFQLEKLS